MDRPIEMTWNVFVKAALKITKESDPLAYNRARKTFFAGAWALYAVFESAEKAGIPEEVVQEVLATCFAECREFEADMERDHTSRN